MQTRTRQLDRANWSSYFDAISKHLVATTVSVQVCGADLGSQVETEKLQLAGLTYDAADDALEIATEVLSHRIDSPRAIHVQEDAAGRLVACLVEDGSGREQILQLEPSLTLAVGS